MKAEISIKFKSKEKNGSLSRDQTTTRGTGANPCSPSKPKQWYNNQQNLRSGGFTGIATRFQEDYCHLEESGTDALFPGREEGLYHPGEPG